MKDELDKKLCAKYPKIFADRNLSMKESCMHWGLAVEDGWYDIIDVLCSSIQSHIDQSIKSHDWAVKHNAMVSATRLGDMSLFNEYYSTISDEWKQKYFKEITEQVDEGNSWSRGIRPVEPVVEQVVAEQVKEKFGGLRFYYRGGDQYISGLVRFAETMSYRVCEDCGKPGKPNSRGWIRTTCPEHTKADQTNE